MKRLKKYLTNIVDLILVYAFFVYYQESFKLSEWQETIPELFIFIILSISVFKYMQTFLK